MRVIRSGGGDLMAGIDRAHFSDRVKCEPSNPQGKINSEEHRGTGCPREMCG